jgi:2-polyprenyl-3-methyl-5-hydroxy-6-metoxy-1,4-benzoquinol methylase
MSILDKVAGNIELDANSVWRLRGPKSFDYSDGESSEEYLRDVFQKAGDLSSQSYELERYVRDWPSEYHLSRKRSQLLRGFTFDRNARVLEVGCGCGAITRYLGETFDDVVAIEGSPTRATLARMRTRDMPNVSILNAPFQDVRFKTPFDIIFCIGVIEYSKMFVGGPDPHDSVLRFFSDMLAPDGAVVIAIENQFGLKYFASSAEDHNGIMFDGLEAYPRHDTHRTFGYGELRERLARHFREIRFLFPYPDYKLPSCVLSEEAFRKANFGEVIGNFAPRDYSKARTPVFDQRLVLMELAKNGMLHFFSNSFLVVAGKADSARVAFDALGILFSDHRKKEFQTVTRIAEHKDGSVWAEKRCLDSGASSGRAVTLRGYKERWLGSDSIQMRVLKKAKRKEIAFSELFEPCGLWMEKIRSMAVMNSGELVVDGRYVDCIWANSFVENGRCVFIDNEWAWKGDIRVNVLFIRSAYYLLNEIRGMRDLNVQLAKGGTKSLVEKIGRELGVKIGRKDWEDFWRLEAEFTGTVTGGRGTWGNRLLKKVRRALSRVWEPGNRRSAVAG